VLNPLRVLGRHKTPAYRVWQKNHSLLLISSAAFR